MFCFLDKPLTNYIISLIFYSLTGSISDKAIYIQLLYWGDWAEISLGDDGSIIRRSNILSTHIRISRETITNHPGSYQTPS